MQRRSITRPRQTYPKDALANVSSELRSNALDNEGDAYMNDAQAEELSDVDATAGGNEKVSGPSDTVGEPIKKKRVRRPITTEDLYTRNVLEAFDLRVDNSLDGRRRACWGPSPQDYVTVSKAIERWFHLPVLPSLRDGFHRPWVQDEQAYQIANHEDWSWCCNEQVQSRQVSTQIDAAQIADQVPALDDCIFLLGSTQDPKQFELPPRQSINVDDAFGGVKSRQGYILNIGAAAHNLDWVPNQTGPVQYLVVAPSKQSPLPHPPYEAPNAPAYTPTAPSRAYLQIWRIDITGQSKAGLKMLLGTDYGEIKKLQFCHNPARTPGYTPRLLGSIWSDGGLRVIMLPEISDDDALQVHIITNVAVESKAPDTVYSCFTWMSPRRIAAGCANGCVAVFDLSDISRTQSESEKLKPRKYSAVSPTYILNIATCAPSCPTLLLTSSMDGHMRMTDTAQTNISSPSATISAPRTRTILTTCVWHDYMRAGLVSDDSFGVRAHPARRIFTVFTIGRTRSTPVSMAVSQCHPFLLVGTAAGDVQSLNPLIKLTKAKAPVWQQIWFAHEWRRGTDTDAAKTDRASQNIAKHGLSRFTEGYKAEKMMLNKLGGGSDGQVAGYGHNAVHERQSTITALAWNSNLHAGGWAAAGMGNGLVRVENLALPDV